MEKVVVGGIFVEAGETIDLDEVLDARVPFQKVPFQKVLGRLGDTDTIAEDTISPEVRLVETVGAAEFVRLMPDERMVGAAVEEPDPVCPSKALRMMFQSD